MLIQPLGTKFYEMLSEIDAFLFEENSFENVVCEMPAILSRPQ